MSGIKICVVSGSRAEFGQLLPLLIRLENDDFFDLDFVVTGAHLSQLGGDTIDEINKCPITISNYIPIPSIGNNMQFGIAKQISETIELFANYFNENRPDILIAIGDRYEMFAIGIAASTLLIPIAHICGGSTTSGAIDEIYRHSLTKMSQIHFTTCSEYRRRVIQLGENPKYVFDVGSLAIENCLNEKLVSEKELKEFVGIPISNKYCVVTFHPVTLEGDSYIEEINELINALDCFPDYSFIITLSNSDAGGNVINQFWKNATLKRSNFHVVPSLGMKRYLSALKYSEMMIGNSSSGTTEGPAMHIPTIDIGDRQKGRFFAESVIHCEPKKRDIVNAINEANSDSFRLKLREVKNPFGDGTTSQKMVKILKHIIFDGEISLKKQFYDVSYEVKE